MNRTSEERSGGDSTTTLERVKRFESFRSTQNTPDVTPTAPQKPQHSPQVQPKPTRAASLPQHDAHRTDTPPMLTSRVHERSNSETMTSEDSTLRPSQLFSARKPRVQRDRQTDDATRHDDVDSDVSMTASFKDRRKLFESVPTMSVADSTTQTNAPRDRTRVTRPQPRPASPYDNVIVVEMKRDDVADVTTNVKHTEVERSGSVKDLWRRFEQKTVSQ